ncbi:MAG: AMP nucleosidase [Pseudomonadota bacterium]
MRRFKAPAAAVDALEAIYADSADALRKALNAFVEHGTLPDDKVRGGGAFCYPKLRIVYAPDGVVPPYSRAYGKFEEAGVYAATIARPALFRDYLIEQIGLLIDAYGVEAEVGRSSTEIPYPYVLDIEAQFGADAPAPSELARLFPTPDLAGIDDGLANCGIAVAPGDEKPLSLFSGPRVDYSLQRLAHYTGTPADDFQQYILFTNYHRYVNEFVEIGLEKLKAGDFYTGLSAAGHVAVDAATKDPLAVIDAAPWRKHQMPAYHLKAPGKTGISLVNIGVGPSNAKTITDHLAVLRPQCWIMIGHCGGLRQSQRLGDYVLAHAYLRCDGVLDEDLPPEIPIPPLAEIQVALNEAASIVTGDRGAELKRRLRTGTVVTNDDRNWELRYESEARRFNQSRAVAVDMESATIAANGFRFRAPYGTLLCVSDKPLHGEIKLPGAANRFYERSISEHMKIGIETIELLRRNGPEALHSRKLRSFDEPPFR